MKDIKKQLKPTSITFPFRHFRLKSSHKAHKLYNAYHILDGDQCLSPHHHFDIDGMPPANTSSH